MDELGCGLFDPCVNDPNRISFTNVSGLGSRSNHYSPAGDGVLRVRGRVFKYEPSALSCLFTKVSAHSMDDHNDEGRPDYN
jgi:hypothetical protein